VNDALEQALLDVRHDPLPDRRHQHLLEVIGDSLGYGNRQDRPGDDEQPIDRRLGQEHLVEDGTHHPGLGRRRRRENHHA
jgi:hypothetical protein